MPSSLSCGSSQIMPFSLPDCPVPFESLMLIFQSDEGLPTATPESMREHFRRVPYHKCWIVPQYYRQMTQFHPALRFPAQELDLLTPDMFGMHYRGRAVVFFESLMRDKPSRLEIFGHRSPRIRHRVLNVRPIYIATGHRKVAFD